MTVSPTARCLGGHVFIGTIINATAVDWTTVNGTGRPCTMLAMNPNNAGASQHGMHNMDYPPTRRPESPRFCGALRAPWAANGPDHLGLCAPVRSLHLHQTPDDVPVDGRRPNLREPQPQVLPRPTAATPVENPYRSCKLTRVCIHSNIFHAGIDRHGALYTAAMGGAFVSHDCGPGLSMRRPCHWEAVSHDLQLQPLSRTPAAAVSSQLLRGRLQYYDNRTQRRTGRSNMDYLPTTWP